MKAHRFSRETFLLLGILALAFVVRLWGAGFGLPFLYHADEPIVVNHALAFGTGDLNPHFFNIPPLTSYLLFICYGIYYVAGWGAGLFHSVRDFEQLFYFDPSSFYLIARLVFGVFLGTLSVYILFPLVKRLGDMRTALWSSFFLATNFLHVRDSHYIYADIPLVFVLLLGMTVILSGAKGKAFDAVRHCEEPRRGDVAISMHKNKIASPAARNDTVADWKWHLLIGGVIGLATATKYNGVFLAIPYLWVCVRRVPWKQWPVFGCLAAASAGAVFFVLNPYAMLDHAFFVKELSEQSAANSGGLPWFHHLTYSLVGALGWPMLLLSLLGAFWALLSKDVRSQAIAVFVVGYYAVLCRFGQPYDRYVLPLVPFMLILAAEALARIKVRFRLLFWILIPLAVFPSIIKTVYWDRLMAAPDVRTVAKEWVEANIPSGSSLALDGGFYMPRLAFSPKQLEEKKSRAAEGFQSGAKMRRLDALLSKPYQPAYELHFLSNGPEKPGFLFAEPLAPFDLKTLRRKGIQYVLLIEALRPGGDSFYQALQNSADLIMTFSPYRNREDLTIHDPQTMTGGPFLWKDIVSRERGGYPISIYKVRS
jgi:4-amino-4-deoxy-L-arabinose transferase-like glycosyltransferase